MARKLTKAFKNTAPKAYGYVRVSTDRQANEGESLTVQIELLKMAARLEGLELAEVFVEEGVSGAKALADRPEGAKLLSAVKSGDTIMCMKLDRLFRNANDALATFANLKKKGIGLYLKDMGGLVTGSTGELFFTILSGMATFERSRISDRVTETRANLKKLGRKGGGSVPFGFKVEVRDDSKQYLVADDTIMTELSKLREQGYSSRLAAAHMASLGYPCSHSAVQSAWLSIEG
jgi:DNA invertase Pin-like site-specific DNA recombinase